MSVANKEEKMLNYLLLTSNDIKNSAISTHLDIISSVIKIKIMLKCYKRQDHEKIPLKMH